MGLPAPLQAGVLSKERLQPSFPLVKLSLSQSVAPAMGEATPPASTGRCPTPGMSQPATQVANRLLSLAVSASQPYAELEIHAAVIRRRRSPSGCTAAVFEVPPGIAAASCSRLTWLYAFCAWPRFTVLQNVRWSAERCTVSAPCLRLASVINLATAGLGRSPLVDVVRNRHVRNTF